MKTGASERWPPTIAKWAGGGIIFLASMVLLGWWLDLPRLKSVLPDWPNMAPLTAGVFILSGVALWDLAAKRPRMAAFSRGPAFLAGSVVLIGGLKISENWLGWPLGVDALGFHAALGQMATATALNFILLGTALILATTNRLAKTFQFIILTAMLVGWLGFARFLFGGAPTPPFSIMAIHSEASFLLLGTGILCLRPERGLMALLISDSTGGTLARRLILPVLLMPSLLSWGEAQIARSGVLSEGMQAGLFTLDDILVLGALAWFNAARLHRADLRRRRIEETNAQLASIVEFSADAIISKDLNGIVTSWNRGAEIIFGFSAEEMIGTSLTRLIPLERLAEENLILGKIAQGQSVKHFETVRLTRRGNRIDVSITASPLKNAAGEITGVSKVARDITARKQMEATLCEREAQLRLYAEHSPAAIAMLDRDMRYLVVSRRWMADYRLGEQSLIGRSHYEVFPEIPPHWKEMHERCLGGAVESCEAEAFARADGSTDWIHWEVWPWRQADGSVGGIIIFSEDLSESRRAAEEVRASEARLRMVTDNARVGLVMVDRSHCYTFANASYATMLGLASADIIGRPVAEVLAPLYEAQIRPRLNRAFAGERVAYELHHSLLGEDRHYAVRYEPAGDPVPAGETVSRVVVVITDVTEQRKLEAQVRQSQKMEGIGQLAGGVAHDFNNILAVIQMQAELLRHSGGLTAVQVEYANEIGTTVQRATALTRQLLLFSRREVFQPRILDLGESVASMTKLLKRTLGENIGIELKLASAALLIHADAGMLDQVLLNLAVNSRDAMGQTGQLVIQTAGVELDERAAAQIPKARAGTFVCLSVSDNGCGIPPEILSKIFEPFFTTKGVGKGTGLGLATVFGIVEQHDGWIQVESQVGRGTIFRVYLPRLIGAKAPQLPVPAQSPVRGGNETILLVEDDPALRGSVRRTLAQLGYRILEAPTGVKALDVWQANRAEISLLLTDLVMPDGMTGIDLAKRILGDNPRLKVIYMSGYSAEVAGRDFPLNEGVNFLPKPFQSQQLAQAVRHCLDLKAGGPHDQSNTDAKAAV